MAPGYQILPVAGRSLCCPAQPVWYDGITQGKRIMQPHPIGPAWPQYIIPIVVAGFVLLLRVRRMGRARPRRLVWLWVGPAL